MVGEEDLRSGAKSEMFALPPAECVVEVRGLELVAKHAVYANRSPRGDNSKGSGSGPNYVRVTAADLGGNRPPLD